MKSLANSVWVNKLLYENCEELKSFDNYLYY